MEKLIKLGDGQDYKIAPFNVGDLISIEKRFGSTTLDSTKLEPMVYWLYLAVKKNNKDMTIEQLYEKLDMPFLNKGGMQKVFEALSELNEWGKDSKNAPSPVAAK